MKTRFLIILIAMVVIAVGIAIAMLSMTDVLGGDDPIPVVENSQFTPSEFDFRKQPVYVTIPQNATGLAPESGPIPHTVVVWMGKNNTITWANESDRILHLRAYDNSWQTWIGVQPGALIDVQFNHTGYYEYVLESPMEGGISGDVVVLDDEKSNIDALDINEKLQMAQSILGTHDWSTLPLVTVGGQSPDGILHVTIHEKELAKFPDAQNHYENKIKEIIPFDVAVKVDFGPFWRY